MEYITSKDNPKIALAASLRMKKYRDQSGMFLLEGRRLVDDAYSQGVRYLHTYIMQSKEDILQWAVERKLPNICVVSDKVFSKISMTDNTQGIVCVVSCMPLDFGLPVGNSIILDGLQDAGNIGTIIRSAVAANYEDIYLIDCVDIHNDKVIRASMGTIFRARLHKTDYQQIIDSKADFGSEFCIADMNGMSIYDYHHSGNNTIIIGNEGNGVSKTMRDIADTTLSIPMSNNVESLNAAVSASIIMYQLNNGGIR